LLVTVSARHSVDEDHNTSYALSLRNVSDPAIARWDTQKILEHLRLLGYGLEIKVFVNRLQRAAREK
jgi:hypothetical protein